MNKYSALENKEKLYYYMAKSFDALDMKGQARENYRVVVKIYENKDTLTAEENDRYKETSKALERLEQ